MPESYVTIEAVSELLSVDLKTVRNKISAGTLKKGVHWFNPRRLRPRFKRSAIVQWVEESEKSSEPEQGEGAHGAYARNS